MSSSETPDLDRTDESADMIEEPAADDPADLTQSAAGETADKMHEETDQIADEADTTT